MKKFMISFAVIACMAVAMAIGMYIGGHLAQANPAPPAEEPDYNDGVPEYQDRLLMETERGENATAVPACWLLYQAVRCAGQEENDMFFIVVAKEKFSAEPGEIISPKLYGLHIHGYDPDKSRPRTMEDFPPGIWP